MKKRSASLVGGVVKAAGVGALVSARTPESGSVRQPATNRMHQISVPADMTNRKYSNDTQTKKQRAKTAFAPGCRLMENILIATSPADRYSWRNEHQTRRLNQWHTRSESTEFFHYWRTKMRHDIVGALSGRSSARVHYHSERALLFLPITYGGPGATALEGMSPHAGWILASVRSGEGTASAPRRCHDPKPAL